ncbi:MAG: HD domain-containing protein [Planctomycetes bacterium]|nr:HD domain-containing protein [Planctomycetota bacterium]
MVGMDDDARRMCPIKMLPKLPEVAVALCATLGAPPGLENHLRLVHAAAVMLVEGLAQEFAGLQLDAEAVLLGSAIHDIGKICHPEELSRPGTLHEAAGEALLERAGLEPRLARFARTHGNWRADDAGFEDMLVALADSIWKGERREDLEDAICARIAEAVGLDQWRAWSELDAIITNIVNRIPVIA